MLEEKPILFSAPMVRAVLEGRKTQTRRVVKHKYPELLRSPYYPTGKVLTGLERQPGAFMEYRYEGQKPESASFVVPCPYGQPGGKLWVRETWQGFHQTSVEYDEWEEMESPKDRHEKCYQPVYRADGKNFPNKWFPAIHMPREFSRITLDVVQIRVERLHDITEEDAKAEGAEKLVTDGEGEFYQSENGTYRTGFFGLWQHINGAESLESNPWVWVVGFKKSEPNKTSERT